MVNIKLQEKGGKRNEPLDKKGDTRDKAASR